MAEIRGTLLKWVVKLAHYTVLCMGIKNDYVVLEGSFFPKLKKNGCVATLNKAILVELSGILQPKTP